MSSKKASSLLRQFFRAPNTIGAISPSGRRLSRAMVRQVDWSESLTVAEFGPGTGAITRSILEKVEDQHDFFAVEVNEGMVAAMARRYPDVEVHHDSATNIAAICEKRGTPELDAVISGLPWTVFSDELQRDIIEAMLTVLKPGAVFVTFAYWHGLKLKGARRFRRLLESSFTEVTPSGIVWGSFPPAMFYTCRP